MKKLLPAYSLIIGMVLCLYPFPLYAQEASIIDLVVVNSTKDLLAYFTIEEAFNKELTDGVQHGIPITFTFAMRLEMIREGWLDKSISSGSFEHTLTYDNLKKEYTVRQTEFGHEVLVTDDFNKAKRLMSEVNGVQFVSLKDLTIDRRYTLGVKATLEKTTLPLNFHYLVPFSEFWDLKTDWAQVEFLY